MVNIKRASNRNNKHTISIDTCFKSRAMFVFLCVSQKISTDTVFNIYLYIRNPYPNDVILEPCDIKFGKCMSNFLMNCQSKKVHCLGLPKTNNCI